MKLNTLWLVCLAAFPLSAGTIDASSAATVLLESGDSLVFAIPSWNYTANASRYGLPLYPTGVSFLLISAASSVPAIFQPGLQSADGSFSETFGAPLTFVPGELSSYSGPVAALEASFRLTAADSRQIFDGAGAELTLRNLGPAMVFGLPGIPLRQDLFLSLSGGSMSVGALHGAVLVEESVPEPHSGPILIVGGLLLCLASRQFVRLPKNAKSTVCNRLEQSDTI